MQKPRVLIVEDEASIAQALAFLIERAGCQAFLAPDGQMALKASQTAKLDLIILDLMLPRLSGVDLLRLIRDQALNAETPILVLTARGQENDEERVRALGATAFMTKPFSNDLVVAKAKELIGMTAAA